MYILFLQKYVFEKYAVPNQSAEKIEFIKKLASIGVSLRSYNTSLELNEITR